MNAVVPAYGAQLLRKQKGALHIAGWLHARWVGALCDVLVEGGPGLCAWPPHLIVFGCGGNTYQATALGAFGDPLGFV